MNKILIVLLIVVLITSCDHKPTAGATPPAPTKGKIIKISSGEKVNLQDYLVKGKYTLFDFYADW